MTRLKRPWRDNSGRPSLLKLVVFAALFVPGLWTGFGYAADLLGARPLNEAIHQIGLWGYRFLLISLAITPVRRILQWPRLLLVRRMVGVAAFAYIAIHFTLYAADQMFDLWKVGSEIVLRFYLAIGFTALLGLAALAATSTDAMVRRLGGFRWKRLNQIVYAIGILATLHYFMQSKLEVYEPTVMAGLFAWMMLYRVIANHYGDTRGIPVWVTAALGVIVALATAGGEAAYFRLGLGIDPMLILAADLSLDAGIRPAWIVLAVGAGVAAVAALRGAVRRRSRFGGESSGAYRPS